MHGAAPTQAVVTVFAHGAWSAGPCWSRSRLASHNRSARLVERLRWGWRELGPWKDAPEVKAARDEMVFYGVA